MRKDVTLISYVSKLLAGGTLTLNEPNATYNMLQKTTCCACKAHQSIWQALLMQIIRPH